MQINDYLSQYGARISTGRVPQTIPSRGDGPPASEKESFARVLEESLHSGERLKLSKHAQERLAQRSMELSQIQMQKLGEATKKAADKGVKDTLVLMDNMAFIINVQGNLVVTAMKDKDIEGNVFTKIDGAVIV